MLGLRLAALLLIISVTATATTLAAPSSIVSHDRLQKERMAQRVREEFLHAWQGYKQYAWGHDALKPLSKTPHDWYGDSLYMSPVDTLDTMILMGLKREAQETRELIIKNLSFDKDVYVKNFEITIRLLGGLLSGYQLSGDKRLLSLAQDLGRRLLPAFNSPTGIPYMYVNLRTGKVRGPITNPAEAGTLLIEFGTLSKLTRQPVFYDKAKRALVEVYNRRSPIGLVGENINVETGAWTSHESHISGGIDSYYEYLLKCWLLFGDRDCQRMWLSSIKAVNKYLADELKADEEKADELKTDKEKANGGKAWLWYGSADMTSGRRTAATYGALDAFFPAVLALSGDLLRARRLQASSFKMWTSNGIEPEQIDYRTMHVENGSYALRPEIIESAYYLYSYTKDPQYLRMGQVFFDSFVKYCRTEAGYAALSNVLTKEQKDEMESFVFAETFKYFYLLFSPPGTLKFRKVIFNTEAHPITRTW
jgi:ER degradation enhancer, mannosidase alpha-like 2